MRICNHGVVRPLLGRRHRRALADNRAHLPFLARKDSEIVAGLERDGVFVTTLGALGLTGSDEITRIAAALGGAFAPEAHARLSKGQAFLYVPPETVAAHPLLFSWGLQDRLLDIAEAYIGLPAAYDGVCINYTVADGREVSTRRWHRDWEDRKMLKVAIYLHDVDGNNGPFELISRKDSTQSDADGFVYGLADNEDLERRFGANFAKDVISCEGPAGTVIFVDTARFFHRGKPATHGDRIALFYSYFSHRPRHPFLCERTGMPRREIARLSASLSPRQRSAALWRRKLPTILRLVPPARL
ncbi:MAG: hypothetical protein J7500_14420 [Sphingomonas sp.]|nr:hypothetical protein [Sphingomonas sp.]